MVAVAPKRKPGPGRPPKQPSDKLSVRTAVMLTPDLDRRVEEFRARENHLDKSVSIRELVKAGLRALNIH